MESRLFEDIEITHSEGKSVVKGISQGDVKEFRDRVKGSGNRGGSIVFREVQKIDTLRPDGSRDRTIYGEPKPEAE